MRYLVTAALIGLSALAAPSAARAADLIAYPTSTAQQLPISSTQPAFDWRGFYAGVYGSYSHGAVSGDQTGLGIDAGVNVTFNYVLAGAEVSVEGLQGGAGGTGSVKGIGRAGLLVTDNALLYGAAGYGIDAGPDNQGDALVGAGLEYAITDNMSVRGQYLHGFPASGADSKNEITLGAQFHF
ncbi:MAG TPA: hypothetical protein VL418_14770 [Devosiaceae bacterium]|nr:hypothetical protein [Devosiaceae bacterium]